MPRAAPSTALLPRNDDSPLHTLAKWAQKNLAWLKAQLRRRDRSCEDIDDLIQAAILRVAESCERGETRDPAAVLVRTVARLSMNDCRDRLRHPYASDPIEELDSLLLIDPSPPPEEQVAAEQCWTLIGEVLDTVDARTREAFLMNRVHGLSYPQIAQQLGISARTVEKDVTWVMALVMDAAQRRRRPA